MHYKKYPVTSARAICDPRTVGVTEEKEHSPYEV